MAGMTKSRLSAVCATWIVSMPVIGTSAFRTSNMNDLRNLHNKALRIESDKAISICGRPGMAIHCNRGRLWITQSEIAEDFMVPIGTRYCCARHGLIVVDSPWGPSIFTLTWTRSNGNPDFSCCQVLIDSALPLVQEARIARSRQIGELLIKAATVVVWRIKWLISKCGAKVNGSSAR